MRDFGARGRNSFRQVSIKWYVKDPTQRVYKVGYSPTRNYFPNDLINSRLFSRGLLHTLSLVQLYEICFFQKQKF